MNVGEKKSNNNNNGNNNHNNKKNTPTRNFPHPQALTKALATCS